MTDTEPGRPHPDLAGRATGAVSKVLIVGAGPAGLSSAVALRRAGVAVEVVERSATRQVPGSELVVGGSFLRALDALGVAERCVQAGVGLTTNRLCLADGQVLADVGLPRVARAGLPPAAGITRSDLLGILLDAAEAAGAEVRYGASVAAVDNDAEQVRVTFTDGRSGTYDLLVGADGVRSTVRGLVWPDAPGPRYTGQGVWRARVPRVGDPVWAVFFGPRNQVGFVPVSDEVQYLFCVVDARDPERIPEARFPELLRGVLADYGGVVAQARDHIRERAQIYYSGLFNLILPGPWHRGRVVLIGDAAHACTPHLAYGAGIAVEDGVVLADVLCAHDDLPEALEEFMVRRYQRCRMVVENSQQIGEWGQNPGSDTSRLTGELFEQSWAALAEPI
jgi:2-polyprenyl-6-methoxyphenol hydroxylase-like FAD-dependent oxidoreductase